MKPKTIEEWLKTRPECVQKLYSEFPIGSRFVVDGKKFYLIGYTENDCLIVSLLDPNKNYDGAIEKAVYMCAKHFRNGGEYGREGSRNVPQADGVLEERDHKAGNMVSEK